jgi:hypothetical protein
LFQTANKLTALSILAYRLSRVLAFTSSHRYVSISVKNITPPYKLPVTQAKGCLPFIIVNSTGFPIAAHAARKKSGVGRCFGMGLQAKRWLTGRPSSDGFGDVVTSVTHQPARVLLTPRVTANDRWLDQPASNVWGPKTFGDAFPERSRDLTGGRSPAPQASTLQILASGSFTAHHEGQPQAVVGADGVWPRGRTPARASPACSEGLVSMVVPSTHGFGRGSRGRGAVALSGFTPVPARAGA